MKNFTLIFISLILSDILPVYSLHGQTFNPAQIVEAVDTSGGGNDVVGSMANANAYSRGDMIVNGSPCDLYVYCWDAGPLDINYGFAVRQYKLGTPINSGTLPDYEDYRAYSTAWPQGLTAAPESIDAVILEYNGDPYILVCYYDYYGSHRDFIELYKWTGAGGLVLQTGFPMPVSVSGGFPFDWINLDAYNLNDFVITWCENGTVYAKAGTMATGFTMGNTVMLDNSIYGLPPGDVKQPDVALSNVTGGGINTYFVYTDIPEKKLLVTSLSFNAIYTAPPGATLTPAFEDIHTTTTGTFDRPRIDAPDNYSTADWSYVVTDHESNADDIFVGLHHIGTTLHFNANDNSFLPAPDIASTPDHTNDIPVVAYDKSGNNLYYCWYYYSTYNPPSSLSDKAYIGVKITNIGIQTGNSYWIVPNLVQYTSFQPAVALSTQNDASPELFTSFLLLNPSMGPPMGVTGIKTVPWNATSFRPDSSLNVIPVKDKGNISIAPNPFQKSFQILSKQDETGIFNLTLNDLTGRKIMQLTGKLSKINRELSAKAAQLLPGVYFVNVKNENGDSGTFKVVKTE